ncbi:SDR family NAD(P)-dependent oxidoreductase [Streptomyces ficellus]|uniref:SDR family NAD(P)-dependent oxidoreductase n=1 Tax=Streptomyces ficellus TaxID=1977088 RepID=A0ABT7Z6S9_9ACTN|nr:type I polyketide synthase [Streptomyces ficellus]MDN3295180.1 SDR family NAD(P)-dependent oxidoreductase [Streptomyces ficellus]
MSASPTSPSCEPIAVVGAACRLPGGIHGPEDLWAVLLVGRDVVTEVPADRFHTADLVDGRRPRPGTSYTAAGGFLDDITGFDTSYFSGISPREASRMDPQQRLLLELAAETLDDAGIDHGLVRGSDTAVFIGCSSRDYGELQACAPQTGNAYTVTGMAGAIAANRISHFFDWHGQSVTVDTACSSALTAVHQACEHLRSGASRAALAGGVNILINPQGYAGFSSASMLSPTGRCRAFSADADGFVRAEGGGLVLLKRLADARADGDPVHGVILASGTNNDGRTPGLALPSTTAQYRLLREVYARAGLTPDDLAYLEAHGTGTRAGDPVECEAIGRALGTGRTTGALPIGSVKSNIGHLEAASGIAGLLKALLVLRHRRIPATLHAQPLNPDIDFTGWGIRPVLRTEALAGTGRPLAGVNSFGFGGANAHIVLAGPPDDTPSRPPRTGPLPVVVSARTPEALREAAGRMAQRLEFADPQEFYDLSWTATVRRRRHEHRAAVLADSPSDAADALHAVAGGTEPDSGVAAVTGHPGKVAFVFSGNGSPWPGMGADLLREEPVFRAAVEEADAELRPRLGWSVVGELTADQPRLALTEVAQPLLFAVQAGLVRLLAAYGVEPDATVGHSVGEIAAAYVSGALDLRTACHVVAERSRAQALTAGRGRMAAVGLSRREAEKELAAHQGRLELAGVNSDTDVTIAGHPAALADLGRRLFLRDVFFRELDLDYAFHSTAMDGIEQDLRAALTRLAPRPHRRTFASTVTGGLLDAERLDADHWWRNVRQPVLFADAVRALADEGCTLFVEIGPHAVLTPYLRRLLPAGAVVPTCRRGRSGPQSVRRAVAHLVAAGTDAVTGRFPRPGRVVPLPAYPWQRERHWNGSPDWWAHLPQDKTPVHPTLGRRAPVAGPAWHQSVTTGRFPWLYDHQVDGAVVLPGTAYAEAALAAGRHTFAAPAEVTDLDIVRPLVLPRDDETEEVVLQTSLSPEDGIVHIASRTGDTAPWRTHARGRARRLFAPVPEPLDVAAVRSRLTGPRIAAERHYQQAAEAGLGYGPRFQVLTELYVGEGEVLASYTAPAPPGEGPYEAHPALLDGAVQAASPLLAAASRAGRVYLPTALGSVRVWGQPAENGLVHVRLLDLDERHAILDITLTDDDGTVRARIGGCRLRGVVTRRQRTPQQLTPVLRAAPRTGRPAADPAPLPAPGALAAATATARAALEEDHGTRYASFAPRLKLTVGHWAAQSFADLLPHAESFTTEDLITAGVRRKHTAYLRLLAHLAEDAGLLRRATATGHEPPERWVRTGTPRPLELTRACVARFPEWISAIAVYNRCGLHLTQVLRGETDPTELLFSEADRHHVEAFYTDTPQARLQGRYARCLLAAAIESWPADRPLRVLEVGAGTGGVTGALLPVLPAAVTRYVYTDVSPAFFPRAQARFAAHDFIEYRTLDLERDPAEQGLDHGGFDVVVAANVLHATSDLRATLRRVGALLADGGHLLAVESHDVEILGPCFGLLDGFWAFRDTDLRSSPLLPRERWTPLLKECGFDDVADVSSSVAEYRDDYSVLVARRPAPAPAPAPLSGRPAPTLPGGRWHIVTERPGSALGQALASALTGAGATEAVTTSADDGAPRGPQPDGVVVLCESADAAGPQELTARAVRRAATVKAAAGACKAAEGEPARPLWLVTGPTGLFPAPERTGAPEDAAVWGIGRVLANEHPSLPVRRVSLHRSADPGRDAARLVAELLDPTGEDEIVLTGRGRFVPRLADCPPRTARATTDRPYALELRDPGLAPRPVWVAAEPPTPRPGEVVVAVRAAALNYRDVMLAAGLLPPDAEPPVPGGPALGLECAGDVVAVGPGVTGLAAGDRVFAFGHGTLASHVRVRTEQTGRMPDGMRYSEAATLPAVHLTVQHSLETLARLAPGETLLVHGGAGGIGLAALRCAERLGAHVIATAGTPAKRDLLRMLGARHVLDSRGLSFADQVKELTNGRGVDVVLNSLAGEAIARGLECLRPGGRFVELGKRDIYANQPLLLRPFRNNLAYFGVDITRLVTEAPQEAAAAFQQVSERVAAGVHRPLPHQTYPASRIEEALASLRHSRHLGKVVVTMDGTEPVRIEEPDAPLRLDPRATYLVTGGLSGLGAATARHLARRGARSLALLGRRGAASPEAPALIAELGRQGVHAVPHAVDVTDADAVRAVFERAEAEGRPVRGVVHAAMHLDDTPLEELTAQRFEAVHAAKATGAAVLDELTRDRPLDFFVVHSSLAAHVGNLHQAPYAAANLVLESLVRARRAAGLPGLALAWGGIGQTGYVARSFLSDTIERSGLGLISPDAACAALDRFLGRSAESAVVGLVDWRRLAQVLPSLRSPRFERQRDDTDGSTGPGGDAEDFRRRLAEAGGDAERHALIGDALAELAAAVLQTTPDRVDRKANLADLGLDSLMGTQLKASLHRAFGCELPVMELMAAGSVNGLTDRVDRALSRATNPCDSPGKQDDR